MTSLNSLIALVAMELSKMESILHWKLLALMSNVTMAQETATTLQHPTAADWIARDPPVVMVLLMLERAVTWVPRTGMFLEFAEPPVANLPVVMALLTLESNVMMATDTTLMAVPPSVFGNVVTMKPTSEVDLSNVIMVQ